jgi:effector-binding domain-containing protein
MEEMRIVLTVNFERNEGTNELDVEKQLLTLAQEITAAAAEPDKLPISLAGSSISFEASDINSAASIEDRGLILVKDADGDTSAAYSVPSAETWSLRHSREQISQVYENTRDSDGDIDEYTLKQRLLEQGYVSHNFLVFNPDDH